MRRFPFKELNECVICNSSKLKTYVDLGYQPLANNLNIEPINENYFPLKVNYCENCFHSQLSISVNPELMFNFYLYETGTSKIINNYFKNFVSYVEAKFPGKKLKVLEIASNDGTLLKHFQDRGHQVLGVDPAKNITLKATKRGIPTITDFWSFDMAKQFIDKYDVIIAQNVLAHVPEPVDFMLGCHKVLKDSGSIFIQTSQANMLKNYEFDTIYHEHLSFFCANSFEMLAEKTDLYINDLCIPEIHGNSYLLEFTKFRYPINTAIYKRIFDENVSPIKFEKFNKNFNSICDKTIKTVETYYKKGYKIIGFGAAAKGITFINHTGLQLEFIIDDTPGKQGMFTPHSHIPIVSRDWYNTYKTENPTLMVVLPWNFYSNIKEQFKDDNLLFMTYFPEIKVEK